MTRSDTAADTARTKRASHDPAPGVLVVFSREPRFVVIALEKAVGIGRDDAIGPLLGDEKLSRHHAEIALRAGAIVVRDAGSRNGTFVDGEELASERVCADGAVVRAGGTILLTVDDIAPFAGRRVEVHDGIVEGVSFRASLDEIEVAARSGIVLVMGETGTGKEIASRHFHAKGPKPNGPFVALNCATIPSGLAERLLFGAKRGAYSGAMGDTQGHVQAAEGGTLMLDEIGELDPGVQAKLLRLLETKEVMPLGASTPKRVDVRFCFATNRDLRAEVAAGRFRSDLFYRLGEHEIVLPPLRERREDIPWLLASALGERKAHFGLVEACLLRPWPGNVRELLREARHAATAAGDEPVVRDEHLRVNAGAPLGGASKPAAAASELGEADVRAALEAHSGNISAAARSLGLHRTQLKRSMKKLGVT